MTVPQADYNNISLWAVPIEPSIREGEKLVPSILGGKVERPAVALNRFPPVNTSPPVITGNPKIPNLLSCDPGQWNSSPAAKYNYQWMADGVDIPGATSSTWLSELAYADTSIRCEVRGYNSEGEDYALSNSIDISVIQEIQTDSLDVNVLTGYGDPERLTTFTDRNHIITGLGQNWDNGITGSVSLLRSASYFIQGLGAGLGATAFNRVDTQSMFPVVLTGLGQDGNPAGYTTLSDIDVYAITPNQGVALVSGIPQPMPLKNPSAELGMGGWTRPEGSGVYAIFETESFSYDDQDHGTLSRWSFFGGNIEDPATHTIYQDVPIWPIWQPSVDNGGVNLQLSWVQRSPFSADQATIAVEFYDATDQLIGTANAPMIAVVNLWIHRNIDVPIPQLTRYIRVIPTFFFDSGINVDSRIDSISMNIRLGTAFNNRSYGPNFSAWRIRFTEARTWPGCALSEIEMRNVIGGSDLTSNNPAKIITGSEALGGSKDFAFDNQINTGYWAGDLNGISEGTSWIGYEFSVSVKPKQLAITSRDGTDALQMGRAFVFEGRATDGVWRQVQKYENIPAYDLAETKLFPVNDGAQPTIRDNTTAITYGQNWNLNTKGNIYRFRTRFNLESVDVKFAFAGVDAKVFVCQISYEGSPRGMVINVLATGTHVSSGALWENIVLDSTINLEVDDEILIAVQDTQVNANANGRINDFTTVTYTVDYPYNFTDHSNFLRTLGWAMGKGGDLALGDVAQDPGIGEYHYFCIEPRGSVF